jgi:hypothetical protein
MIRRLRAALGYAAWPSLFLVTVFPIWAYAFVWRHDGDPGSRVLLGPELLAGHAVLVHARADADLRGSSDVFWVVRCTPPALVSLAYGATHGVPDDAWLDAAVTYAWGDGGHVIGATLPTPAPGPVVLWCRVTSPSGGTASTSWILAGP